MLFIIYETRTRRRPTRGAGRRNERIRVRMPICGDVIRSWFTNCWPHFQNGVFHAARSRTARRRAGYTCTRAQPFQQSICRRFGESLPGDHIEPGKVAETCTAIDQIGVTLRVSGGLERRAARAQSSRPLNGIARKSRVSRCWGRESELVVKACRRTLLSVWRNKPGFRRSRSRTTNSAKSRSRRCRLRAFPTSVFRKIPRTQPPSGNLWSG